MNYIKVKDGVNLVKYDINIILNKDYKVQDKTLDSYQVSINSTDSPDTIQEKLKFEIEKGITSFINYENGKIIMIPSDSIQLIEVFFSSEEHQTNMDKIEQESSEGMSFFVDGEDEK
jgi:hypothetical protein